MGNSHKPNPCKTNVFTGVNMKKRSLKIVAAGFVILFIFSTFDYATLPVNLKHVDETSSLYILNDKFGASNITTYNITKNGNLGFTVGIDFSHNLTLGEYNGQVLYVMLFGSNGTLPLTNVGFSISKVSFTSKLMGFDGYTETHNSTVETVLLKNLPSIAGNGTIALSFTLTPIYEFLFYHYSGKSVTFTFSKNVTVTG